MGLRGELKDALGQINKWLALSNRAWKSNQAPHCQRSEEMMGGCVQSPGVMPAFLLCWDNSLLPAASRLQPGTVDT